MANHLPRVMRNLGKQIILYTPVVKNEHFLNAVSYLVRRLDENTGKDNFLSYSFNLKYNSKQWNFLQQQFLEAFALKDKIEAKPFRTQDRNKEAGSRKSVVGSNESDLEHGTRNAEHETFKNEPDTNFDLKPNRLWADTIRTRWMKSVNDKPYQIPVQIGMTEVTGQKKYRYIDRSQKEEVCVCEANQSNLDQVKEIITVAETDSSNLPLLSNLHEKL
jgi:RHH-type proline utilization regulon transcriptional repressor/proline dehydrogenase/delta 1-pyrroline-5-carboxylate dehydrogenase